MTPRRAFTIGYEGATPDALVATLRGQSVTVVVDTRQTPTSRRPAYRRKALERLLTDSGVRYESRPELGVPRAIRPLARSRRWLFEMAYRGVLRRADATVKEMIDRTVVETVALLCFEVDPGECHRGLLATSMASQSVILFDHLRVGDREDADDHPAPVAMMRAEDQVELTPG